SDSDSQNPGDSISATMSPGDSGENSTYTPLNGRRFFGSRALSRRRLNASWTPNDTSLGRGGVPMKNANPTSDTFIAANMSVSADSRRFWHSSYTWMSTSENPRPNPADLAPNKIRDPLAKCTPRLSS